jgi:hypothetical protein
MRSYLVGLTLAALTFLQACTGGQLTDANGNAITGNANSTYQVTFGNVAANKAYTTGVDSQGFFSFDPNAPASATNNPVRLPVGEYYVYVSLGNGFFETTRWDVSLTYNNSNCSDFYNKKTESCALFQLQLLGAVDYEPRMPYASSYLGYQTTVIPLKLYLPHIAVEN